jgi:putative oxidoreductase
MSMDMTTGTTTGGRWAWFEFAAQTFVTLARLVSPLWLVQLVLRVALAVPFWRSGVLKWSGFLQLNDTAIDLFTEEFKLHLPGGPYDFPAPELMAFLSGSVEIIAPILLVLGFATRFAALAILGMTVIVELTVPDGWPIHITWVAMAWAILANGPGLISLDAGIAKLLGLGAKAWGYGAVGCRFSDRCDALSAGQGRTCLPLEIT